MQLKHNFLVAKIFLLSRGVFTVMQSVDLWSFPVQYIRVRKFDKTTLICLVSDLNPVVFPFQ